MNISDWLSGCMEVEHRMSEIYGLLANRFNEEEALFKNLHKEEMDHINTLSLVESSDDEERQDLDIEARVLLRTIDAADIAISKIRTSALGLEEALKSTLSLEEGIVENFTRTVVPLGSSKPADVIRKMNEESITHSDMIREALLRHGFTRDS